MALKENYKDDILDVSVNTKRKYRMTENADGTISLDDETVYTQEGDSFGASDLNAMAHAINNTSSDAEHTSYDNTESGLVSDNVQGAIDEINDNLSGFKFYPTGTGIVGLISDDSAYTDEDGNYVIWGTATANQLVADNPNTYKSVPSEEDLRGKEGEDIGMKFGSGNNMSAMLDYCSCIPGQTGKYSFQFILFSSGIPVSLSHVEFSYSDADATLLNNDYCSIVHTNRNHTITVTLKKDALKFNELGLSEQLQSGDTIGGVNNFNEQSPFVLCFDD